MEMMTYRFRGHHVGDAATYRTAKELKWWMENRDPINLLGERMIKHGIADRSRLERVDEQVEDGEDDDENWGEEDGAGEEENSAVEDAEDGNDEGASTDDSAAAEGGHS